MSKIIILPLLSIFLVVMDYIWIGLIMPNFYKTQMGSIARIENGSFTPNIGAAALVYLSISILIIIFVLPLASKSYVDVIKYGALFGFLIYCFYDFTNYALLSQWTIKLTLVDVAWGTFLSAATSVFALWLSRIK